MDDEHVLELEYASDPRVLPEARRTMRDWTLPQGWSEDQTAEIALAVDEALSNVIRHAYDCERCHRILLSARALRDPRRGEGIEIRIRDFGKQCDPAQIRGRDLDEVRPGGLGVHIIRAMMSEVQYTPAEGGGMLLIMRKYKDHSARNPRASRHE